MLISSNKIYQVSSGDKYVLISLNFWLYLKVYDNNEQYDMQIFNMYNFNKQIKINTSTTWNVTYKDKYKVVTDKYREMFLY